MIQRSPLHMLRLILSDKLYAGLNLPVHSQFRFTLPLITTDCLKIYTKFNKDIRLRLRGGSNLMCF